MFSFVLFVFFPCRFISVLPFLESWQRSFSLPLKDLQRSWDWMSGGSGLLGMTQGKMKKLTKKLGLKYSGLWGIAYSIPSWQDFCFGNSSGTLNRKDMNQCDSQQKTYESVWLSTENVWISETLNRKRMNQCDSQQKTYESVWLSTENVWISVTLNRKHMNHSAWTGCNQNVTPSYCGSLQKAIEWDHSSGRICQQFLHLSIMSQFPLHPCLTLCKRYIATVGMFMYCRSLFSSISIFFPVPHK